MTTERQHQRPSQHCRAGYGTRCGGPRRRIVLGIEAVHAPVAFDHQRKLVSLDHVRNNRDVSEYSSDSSIDMDDGELHKCYGPVDAKWKSINCYPVSSSIVDGEWIRKRHNTELHDL